MAIDRSLYCHLPTRRQFHARFLRQAQKSRFADRVQRGVKTNCWHPCALTHGHLVLHSFDRNLRAEQIHEVRTAVGQYSGPAERVIVWSGLRFQMRQAVAITGVALLVTAITCAEPHRQTQPSPSGSTITLTNSDCTSEGLSGVLQRVFVVAVVNTTSSKAAFNLHRLMDGHAYRELELHIQQRQQGIAAGNDTPVFPPMTVHVVGVDVEPGQRGKLEGTLSSGTYGIVCRRDAPTGKSEAIYVKGPFQVN